MTRQYFGIEALNLTAGQRATLVAALQGLGRNNAHPQPSHRNHWRIRPDNLAVIFEADFNDDEWTVAGLKARLAAIFGIDPALVTTAVAQTVYGPVVTFTRTSDRLRLVAFGGLLATWAESRAAAVAYLKANAAAWGDS